MWRRNLVRRLFALCLIQNGTWIMVEWFWWPSHWFVSDVMHFDSLSDVILMPFDSFSVKLTKWDSRALLSVSRLLNKKHLLHYSSTHFFESVDRLCGSSSSFSYRYWLKWPHLRALTIMSWNIDTIKSTTTSTMSSSVFYLSVLRKFS